jgi:hypothetical protein
MIAVAWALYAAVLGCALIYRFGGLSAFQPRWAAALLISGGGIATGIGLTSGLFFLCRLAVPAAPKLALFFETAILLWLAYDIWRKREPVSAAAVSSARFPLTPLLMAAAILALGIATGAMTDAWANNPQGEWDAWSIWNLRARFLAAPGALPHRAWSSALTWTHPEYPLLLSGFVARCWTYAGSTTEAAPMAVSYLFFLALLAMLTGGVAIWRSRALGLLAGLILLGSPMFLHEVVVQYADVPLACYFAGATIFALLDRPLLAGLLAGFAAWTKDEGLLFLAVFFAAMALLRRRGIVQAAAGAIPFAALTLIFKFALAPRASTFFGQSLSLMMGQLVDGGRIGQALGELAHEIAAVGIGWYHPILPVMALAAAFGFDRGRRADLLFAGAIPAAMLAGYFAIFLITPFDLKWQLQTSLYRLLEQVWPSVLIAAFAALRTPESSAAPAPEAPIKSRKKAKLRHA